MISDYYFYICILHTGRCKTRFANIDMCNVNCRALIANQNADTRLYERPVLREGSA